MGKIEEFKSFVKDNPVLLKHVRNNEMTWQKFYEMYDLYGTEDSTWSTYLDNQKEPTTETKATKGDFVGWIKGLDLDSVNEGVASIQRVLGVLGELSPIKGAEAAVSEYKPRPLYKHFDD